MRNDVDVNAKVMQLFAHCVVYSATQDKRVFCRHAPA